MAVDVETRVRLPRLDVIDWQYVSFACLLINFAASDIAWRIYRVLCVFDSTGIASSE